MKYFLLKPDNIPERWLRACLNLTQFYFWGFIQYNSSLKSLLGTYFKDLVNQVIEERSKKAVLVDEVKKQYEDRQTVQTAQNKSLNEKLALNAQEMKMLQEYIAQMPKA